MSSNLSTATADTDTPLTVIGSNRPTCSVIPSRKIAGTLNTARVSVVNCNNLLPGAYQNLPNLFDTTVGVVRQQPDYGARQTKRPG